MEFADKFIEVGGTTIRYRERTGDGTPILFIHGISESLEFWDRQLDAGIGNHRLIALDLPGHGLSGLGDQPYDLEKFAALVPEFADALGIGRFFCVGNSLGGAISVRVANLAPERVAGIVLANSAALGREVFLPFRIMTLPIHGELMTKPGKTGIEQQLKAIFHRSNVITDDIRKTVERNLAKAGGQKAFLATLRMLTGFSSQRREVWERTRTLLGTLSVPVLIIHGKQDAVLPAGHSIDAQAVTPNSKLVLLDDCGHTPQIEHSEVFNRTLCEFVAA